MYAFIRMTRIAQHKTSLPIRMYVGGTNALKQSKRLLMYRIHALLSTIRLGRQYRFVYQYIVVWSATAKESISPYLSKCNTPEESFSSGVLSILSKQSAGIKITPSSRKRGWGVRNCIPPGRQAARHVSQNRKCGQEQGFPCRHIQHPA